MNPGVILSGYPGLVPGLLVFVALGLVLMRRLGQVLGVGPWHAFALVMGAGLALSATLTPGAEALVGIPGTGTCDVSRIGLATQNQVGRADEVALNLALLIPLGMAIGYLTPSRTRLALLGAAILLPFVVEMAQLVVVRLGRECQSGDVIDNLTGLTIGIGIGIVARWIVAVRRQTDPGSTDPRAGVASLAIIGFIVVALLAPTPRPTTRPLPTPTPTPVVVTPAPTNSVRVTTVPALLAALADDTIDEIVVADGTYEISTAATQATDSLWIGARFANRTLPVTVRAETSGGVTFDGRGSEYFGGISFEEGAHHQTWDGFVFANGTPTQTGVITFGGYEGMAAAHHITLSNITIPASVTSTSPGATDHGVYVAEAVDGVHDLLIDGLVVDGAGGLDSAIQFYGSSDGNPNAWNVTVRRLQVTGTEQALIIWDSTLRDITIEDAVIVDARDFAVRYESPRATNVILRNVNSVGSGSGQGFESNEGSEQPGLTFINTSLH
jgi:hypothetical protein